MPVKIDEMPVVEARASHRLVIDSKAKLAYEMQGRARGRTRARDAARVGGDLRLDEDNAKSRPKWGYAEL